MKKKFLIITNINFFYLEEIFKKLYKKLKIYLEIDFLHPDNVDLKKIDHETVIVIIDPLILFEDIEFQVKIKSVSNYSDFVKYFKLKLNGVNRQLKKTENVYITNFFNYSIDKLDSFFHEINSYLEKSLSNINILNVKKFFKNEKIPLVFSKRTKINFHNPFNKKYEILFAKHIFNEIDLYKNPKKVIVFDCDNTLWNGIIGEDKIKEIEFNNETNTGRIFYQIHLQIKNLLKKGVMIAICSKNNYEDVKKIFSNKKMLLNLDDFTSIRVNWKNKFENIREIADELNVSTDSLLFIDDNLFEVNSVKKNIPNVTCFKVPNEIYDYPDLLNDITNTYFKKKITKEDLLRNKNFRDNKKRLNLEKTLGNMEKFLNSLKIEIKVEKNERKNIDRIVQMCQKTNQFNFTTIRHTDSKIKYMLKNKNYDVFTFTVKDKFGDYGITALIICQKLNRKIIEFDTFLMSCRILGKNIHSTIFKFISNYYKKKKFNKINIKYIKTHKNVQLEKIMNDFGKFPEFIKKKNSLICNINIKDDQPVKLNNYRIQF